MALSAVVGACLAGCADSSSPGRTALPSGELDADDVGDTFDALSALGYVDYVEESDAPGGESGLLHFDERASDGYRLIVAIPSARALLVDRDGRVRHEWSDPACRQWTRAELGPDGDLLVIGKLEAGADGDEGDPELTARERREARRGAPDQRGGGRFLARYRWDGSRVWRRRLRVHHDAEWMPNGELLAIADRARRVDGLHIQDDRLLVLTPDGEVTREYSMYDLLTSRPELFDLPRSIQGKDVTLPDGRVDLFHTNSCEQMPFASLRGTTPLHRASSVLVSVRHQDLVAIVDLASEELLWTWGPGIVRHQHEATWLENGNVLLFDNGMQGRGWSRVVEVDPTTDEIVWEYAGSPPEAFFSSTRGTSQELPNGNVLIASSSQGEVFEVTREGEVVWRFVERAANGKLMVLRARHYAVELVDPLLGGE